MNILRETIGLAFIILAWLDLLELGIIFRVLFFIIGFDLMSLISKIMIFGLDYYLDILGLGWTLLLLIGAEAAVSVLKLSLYLNTIIKPLIVFLIVYLNEFGLTLALIIAGMDLILNATKKYI